MATLPIPGLLAEFKILGLQAMDFGAQLNHFRPRVLHWGDQLREEVTGKTDLCQLAVHDHLSLADIAPKGKGLVLFHHPRHVHQLRRCEDEFWPISRVDLPVSGRRMPIRETGKFAKWAGGEDIGEGRVSRWLDSAFFAKWSVSQITSW